MNILKQLRNFFLTTIIAFVMTLSMFGFGYTHNSALANPGGTSDFSSAQSISMNRAEIMGKDLEGKTQETIGNITGDTKDQFMGKAKQVESQVRNTMENVKDDLAPSGRMKAVQKNIEGKAQEEIGNVTGNRQDQFSGKAKQLESNIRNAVEDVKNTVDDVFQH
ncbi:general stress protein CsbD [Picosynechococcus sp. PCC 7003]|uniref:CsbD family protein n=1 Tax=Picosynechococcus sp. PCC 7003 TaxID=374981 RepID=UPI000810EAFA|nr:CsbD family protein [Picosynechococcus sp. PCC 7003]ANV83229.1 general stress protein CsbD [Picosynechococcus sp. PCC 7003]